MFLILRSQIVLNILNLHDGAKIRDHVSGEMTIAE